MARPLRIEYEGACYHVINRGNHRETVFQNSEECSIFLKKLAYFAEVYGVTIYSYCLMPNHFHLFLKTEHANLGKFMQSFLTSFTVTINRKYSKSGHLFQGRYKAVLVESDLHKNRLSRYIHLNPVKLKGNNTLSTDTLIQRLNGYEWSSYPYYIGLKKKPAWLNRRFVLSNWGKNSDEKIDNYRNYVEKGVKTDNTEEVKMEQQILGSSQFREKIFKKYLKQDLADIDTREQPILASINSFNPLIVISAVNEYYNLKNIKQITVRQGSDRQARKIAMYLTSYYCRRRESLTTLAKIFGLKISGYTSAVEKVKSIVDNNKNLKNDINGIIMILQNKKRKTEFCIENTKT